MNEILISFILVINAPSPMTMTEAKKASVVSIQKLNTLYPFKFKASRIIKMRDPFPDEVDGYKRLPLLNSRIQRSNTVKGTYATVFDRGDIKGILGLAFLCQSLDLKKQVSLVVPSTDAKGIPLPRFTGLVAAHETGHQLGFPHVSIFDNFFISIMSFDLAKYRYIPMTLKRFIFYDKTDLLPELNCKQNTPRSSRKIIQD